MCALTVVSAAAANLTDPPGDNGHKALCPLSGGIAAGKRGVQLRRAIMQYTLRRAICLYKLQIACSGMDAVDSDSYIVRVKHCHASAAQRLQGRRLLTYSVVIIMQGISLCGTTILADGTD
eukprot:COSAG02_NODE_5358_length_4399_cov_16.010930_4_plen_121_part_00